MCWLQCLPGLFLTQSGQDGILEATEATAVHKPPRTRSSTDLLAASARVGAHLSQPHITVLLQGRRQRVLKQPQTPSAGSDKQRINPQEILLRAAGWELTRFFADNLFPLTGLATCPPHLPAEASGGESGSGHRGNSMGATGPGRAERAVLAAPGTSHGCTGAGSSEEQRAAIHSPRCSSRSGG